jgi:hypothetical protein
MYSSSILTCPSVPSSTTFESSDNINNEYGLIMLCIMINGSLIAERSSRRMYVVAEIHAVPSCHILKEGKGRKREKLE